MTSQDSPRFLKVGTSRFGEIQVDENRVIDFPNGMIGFPQMHRFVLVQHQENSPFFWLQSLDSPDLSFVTVNPILFYPEYRITLSGAESKLLDAQSPEMVQVWVVVTIPHGRPERMTANLKAPVVINLENRRAAQVVLDDPKLSVRHSLSSTGGNREESKG